VGLYDPQIEESDFAIDFVETLTELCPPAEIYRTYVKINGTVRLTMVVIVVVVVVVVRKIREIYDKLEIYTIRISIFI